MFSKQWVLALLALHSGLVHSFSWDIVVAEKERLEFYHYGKLVLKVVIPDATEITSVAYDPVYNRVLFADDSRPNNVSIIASFDLLKKTIQPLLARKTVVASRVAYDPISGLHFWKEGNKIYSRSLISGDEAGDGNLLLTLNHTCGDIALDSCGGYIYWITDYEIGRVRFNGTDTEVLITNHVYDRRSIAFDQLTKRIYWTEKLYENDLQLFIESADFNGENKRRYRVTGEIYANSLTVSEDFIYWRGGTQETIWQLPKNWQPNEKAKLFSKSYRVCKMCQVIAAYYTITEQTQGIQNCKILMRFKQLNNLCLHGTEIIGENRCECENGYTGLRCEIPLCHNYCFQGDCIFNAEGQPKCSCKAGYSGEWCQISECDMYCLNGGDCILDADAKPVCKCPSNYVGDKCEFPAYLIKWIQTVSMLKDVFKADIPPPGSLGKGVKLTCG